MPDRPALTAADLVEAVARAICVSEDPDDLVYTVGHDGPVPAWRSWEPEARAALAAVAKAAAKHGTAAVICALAEAADE